jgi:hypothetical protein
VFKIACVVAVAGLAFVGVVGAGAGAGVAGGAGVASREPSSLEHLPEAVRRDAEAWRARLRGARCLKVEADIRETWAALHDLLPDGSPRVVAEDRYQLHSWMTPGSVWVVAYGYAGGKVDTERPIFQQYWSREEGRAWERTLNAETGAYTVRRYPCDEAAGPSGPNFPARGCLYATATTTWLAGPEDLAGREVSVSSVALMRTPNLAVVPPDPGRAGVWLDVFRESVARNEERGPKAFYHRQDFMLLARDGEGRPEVREWRTVALNDPDNGGRTPQLITGVRALRYTFVDSAPAGLGETVAAFRRGVDGSMGE